MEHVKVFFSETAPLSTKAYSSQVKLLVAQLDSFLNNFAVFFCNHKKTCTVIVVITSSPEQLHIWEECIGTTPVGGASALVPHQWVGLGRD